MTIPALSIGRPQIFAGMLLLALLCQSLWMVARRPLSQEERSYGEAGYSRMSPSTMRQGQASTGSGGEATDSIIVYRIGRAMRLFNRIIEGDEGNSPYAAHGSERWLYRLPFVGFAIWLGGGLWWVTRRMFGSAGGYVAVALYCFCPYVVDHSSRVNPDIVTMWGIFGSVYTAIGVAHTLYAPPRQWRPRILLLGVALGLTATAHLMGAVVSLAMAAAFMIYIAPARRRASCAILLVSGSIGILIFIALHAFNVRESWSVVTAGESLRFRFGGGLAFLFQNSDTLVIMVLLLITVAALVFWPRTRYFGNTAPLMVASVFASMESKWVFAFPLLWALPFIFVFIGGVAADLMETSYRKSAAWCAILLLVANGWLCLTKVAQLGVHPVAMLRIALR